MFNFLKRNNTVDEKEIIEIKKKIAYMETDVSILKTQYQRLLDRYRGESMADARQKKKESNQKKTKGIACYRGGWRFRVFTSYLIIPTASIFCYLFLFLFCPILFVFFQCLFPCIYFFYFSFVSVFSIFFLISRRISDHEICPEPLTLSFMLFVSDSMYSVSIIA